ncbi:Tll0287-like domain-containing protein [Winogradskyella vidalii]|uniref:Tll0287-like domain-containing protein n=1 Tax=Winogradskyella vidalii TaxID=2615024 RepID=UPI0015C9CE68|nr:DUF3365 domain-containing protein [Winogradskyella vidalii]
MKKLILLTLLVVFAFSCNDKKKKDESKLEKQSLANKHPGKKLMETNCYLCHSPTASETDRIGPPMVAIKRHYISKNTTKADFVAAMQTWIENPNIDDAKMPGAVKRFGVMPYQHYPEETIAQISDYMYDFEIDQPNWFEAHYNEARRNGNRQVQREQKRQGSSVVQTNFENLPYGERGLKYALTTKAVLGKNLMGTIQRKGVLEALAFCNVKAYPLTDSMAVVHKAVIKRVTDKPRNSNNKANAEELEYLNEFKHVIANNQEPQPLVKELDDKVKVYYPITTNNMCLQCHGKPNETLKQSTLTNIKRLYPMDQAIGYDINQVRGIWSITFNK